MPTAQALTLTQHGGSGRVVTCWAVRTAEMHMPNL